MQLFMKKMLGSDMRPQQSYYENSKDLEEFGLLLKDVSETIKAKEQKLGFLGISLGTLGTSLLRNL